MRGFRRRPGATRWAGNPGSGVHRPPASALLPAALPTLNTHFSSQGLAASAATRPGLHHSWLCSQSSRWRSGARCPRPPPSCSSPSTPSWVILLPPFSGSPHPHPGSCLPHPWLSDPFPPAPQGAPEAKGRRLGRERRNLETALIMSPTQLKAGATLKSSTWLQSGYGLSAFGNKVRNRHLIKLIIINMR